MAESNNVSRMTYDYEPWRTTEIIMCSQARTDTESHKIWA